MAIIATVAKARVKFCLPNLWNITLNMRLIDDGVEVINRDYSAEYIPGDNIPSKIDRFTSAMQADINQYKGEQAIYTAPALDAAVTDIENALAV